MTPPAVQLASPRGDVLTSSSPRRKVAVRPGLLDAHTVAAGQVAFLSSFASGECGNRATVVTPRSMSPSGHPALRGLVAPGMGGRLTNAR